MIFLIAAYFLTNEYEQLNRKGGTIHTASKIKQSYRKIFSELFTL